MTLKLILIGAAHYVIDTATRRTLYLTNDEVTRWREVAAESPDYVWHDPPQDEVIDEAEVIDE